jgi:hypothetical protein
MQTLSNKRHSYIWWCCVLVWPMRTVAKGHELLTLPVHLTNPGPLHIYAMPSGGSFGLHCCAPTMLAGDSSSFPCKCFAVRNASYHAGISEEWQDSSSPQGPISGYAGSVLEEGCDLTCSHWISDSYVSEHTYFMLLPQKAKDILMIWVLRVLTKG